MIVLVVNNDRYLINPNSKAVDKSCEKILANYPYDAIIEFDKVRNKDLDI